MADLLKKDEWVAIILIALLILTPLAGGEAENFFHSYQQNAVGGNITQEVQGWLTVGVAILTLCALLFQAWTNHEQRLLMEGQLEATKVAADAALAGLDRPWLVVEALGHNELDWLECREPLIVEFQISNYGKAPAFVKRMRLLHFRAINEAMGEPPVPLPGEFVNFPTPDRFLDFIYQSGHQPLLLSDDIDARKTCVGICSRRP